MNIAEKIKLNKEYQAVRTAIAGGAPLLEKIKLNKRLQELRVLLGAGKAPAPQAPQQGKYEGLQKIASGAFDHQGLHEVMRLIQTSINGLGGAEKLDAQGQEQANKAIDHWMQLEAA